MWSRGKNITIEIRLTVTTLIIACAFCLIPGNAAGMKAKACNALVDEIISDRGSLNAAQRSVTVHRQMYADGASYDSRKYTLDDAGNALRIKDMAAAVVVLGQLRDEIARLTAQIAAKEERWDTNCRKKFFLKKKKP